MRHRLRWICGLIGALALACGAALLAPGCDGDEPRPEPLVREENLTVLATTYPLADLARQIGGDYVTAEWLAESGQPLPGNDVSSEVFTRLQSVDFVLSSGEPWAIQGFDDPMRAQRVLRLDVLRAAVGADQPAGLTEHARGLMWLDPAVMREAAEALYQRFAAKRTRLQPYFRARTDEFIGRLDATVRSYEPVLATESHRRALVLSADWARLLGRFQIEALRPVDANPSDLRAADFRRLVDTARQNRVTALFVSADTPAAVIRDIEQRTDLTVLTLDRLGTSGGGGRNTYLEMLRYNLDQLHRGASKGKE